MSHFDLLSIFCFVVSARNSEWYRRQSSFKKSDSFHVIDNPVDCSVDVIWCLLQIRSPLKSEKTTGIVKTIPFFYPSLLWPICQLLFSHLPVQSFRLSSCFRLKRWVLSRLQPSQAGDLSEQLQHADDSIGHSWQRSFTSCLFCVPRFIVKLVDSVMKKQRTVARQLRWDSVSLTGCLAGECSVYRMYWLWSTAIFCTCLSAWRLELTESVRTASCLICCVLTVQLSLQGHVFSIENSTFCEDASRLSSCKLEVLAVLLTSPHSTMVLLISVLVIVTLSTSAIDLLSRPPHQSINMQDRTASWSRWHLGMTAWYTIGSTWSEVTTMIWRKK